MPRQNKGVQAGLAVICFTLVLCMLAYGLMREGVFLGHWRAPPPRTTSPATAPRHSRARERRLAPPRARTAQQATLRLCARPSQDGPG